MAQVFLSYTKRDVKKARRLAKELRGAKHEVWIDEDELLVGESIPDAVSRALTRADYVVVCLSRAATESGWVESELALTLMAQMKQRRTRVLPVRFDDVGSPRPIEHIAHVDLFHGEAAWTHGVGKLLRSIERHDGRAPDGALDRPRVGPEDEGRPELLGDVERVCRVRWPEAEIERIPAPSPFGGLLSVAAREEGIVRIEPVAAVDQPVTEALLDAFVRLIDARFRKDSPWLPSTLVYRGEAAPDALVRRAMAKNVRLRSLIEYRGLIDFRRYLAWQTRRLEADPIYPPGLYVDQRARLHGGPEEREENALSALTGLLTAPHGRFALILGDFGTGKTFLMHELARRMGSPESGVVPVLVEMRSLEKARSLDALLAQHLALAGEERIDLSAFRYMLQEGLIALLFDGFDELALRVSYERAAEYFDTLIQAAGGSAKVVVSSRTQHFFSDRQVKTVLAERAAAIPGHRILKLQPFTGGQIRQFLRNKLGSEDAAGARVKLLDEVKDLLGLSANPRMLSFIAEIPEEELSAAKTRQKEITSAGLYKLLLERWIVYEFDRAHPKGAPPGLDEKQRWKAVTALAMRLWQTTERTVNARELSPDLIEAVQALTANKLEPGVVAHQVGSGTLLTRDEEGNFSFIHQSVLEWIVARAAAEEVKQGGMSGALDARKMSPLMADFFSALAGREAAVQWATAVLDATSDVGKKNALLVMYRLGVELLQGVNLAGQDLRGQDLSMKDLRGAKLTGADLTDAKLFGANLTGASLKNARLVRADLSRARLVRADLEGADLSSAKLLGADLHGANLGGARLRAAALVGAKVDEGALGGCDTWGFAPPVPERVEAMIAPTSECRAVAISPDGSLIASSHEDGSIRLWDIASGQPLRVLVGHSDAVLSIAFHPSGAWIASGSRDTTVRLWDVASGQARHVIKEHMASAGSIAWSPDGALLASLSVYDSIHLWDVPRERTYRILEGDHPHATVGVAFTSDSASLVSASLDGTIRQWSIATGEIKRTVEYNFKADVIAFSPDSTQIALGSLADLHVLDVAGGSARKPLGHTGLVQGIAWQPGGRVLASISDDLTIQLWDLSRKGQHTLLKGHTAPLTSIAFSPDGSLLASAFQDGTVRLWDVGTGQMVRELKAPEYGLLAMAWSPGSALIATAGSGATLRLWNTVGEASRIFRGHRSEIPGLAFDTDGSRLASAAYDGEILVWDVARGSGRSLGKPHGRAVLSVAFSTDGDLLASGSADGKVRLWRFTDLRVRRAFKGHKGRVHSVAFSPDGVLLASASGDGTIRLRDITRRKTRRILTHHKDAVLSLAWRRDSAILASASRDGTTRLWDACSSATVRILDSSEEPVVSVAWSPDGALLASATRNRARLWNGDWHEVLTLESPNSAILSVAWSHDGALLASANLDGTVRLWDPATGECLAVLLSLPEGWASFTPDGRYKTGGDITGAFWHAVGLCRFEPGELEPYLPSPLRIPEGEPLFTPRGV